MRLHLCFVYVFLNVFTEEWEEPELGCQIAHFIRHTTTVSLVYRSDCQYNSSRLSLSRELHPFRNEHHRVL